MGRVTTARQAFIGLGANLGDRAATLRAALDALRRSPGVDAIVPSSWYETDPVGYTEQPLFLNLAAGVVTTLSPEELLTLLQAIEQDHGRQRTVRWGPRTLDLDLLAYEGETRATERLQLPHPRILERAFVTVPLLELLARPEFAGAAWDGLRRDLNTKAPAADGVRVWREARPSHD